MSILELAPPAEHVPSGHLPFTPRAKKVLELGLREGLKLGHNYVGPEHLLLGLLREGEGLANKVLGTVVGDLNELVMAMLDQIKRRDSEQASPKGELSRRISPLLDQFGRNLTGAAADGKLDPVIGRAEEIDHVMRILSRRTRNNPVLIGEPGVGKTAIVEGLAQSMVRNEVPARLRGKELYALDFGALVAGSRYRGDYEERLTKLLREIRTRGDVILLIEDLDRTVAAERRYEDSMNLFNLMKPALSRNELQAVGVASKAGYESKAVNEPSLGILFAPVWVRPIQKEPCVSVIMALRGALERHHSVEIPEDAVMAAVALSDVFIKDSHLPGKALDLLDEAGARIQVALGSNHAEVARPEAPSRDDGESPAITPLLLSRVVGEMLGLDGAKDDDASDARGENADEWRLQFAMRSSETGAFEGRSPWGIGHEDAIAL